MGEAYGGSPGGKAGRPAGCLRVAGARGCRGSRGCGCRFEDRRSAAGDGVPLGAEVRAALAVRLPRALVEREGVEGVLVVGHLQAAVAPPGRAEHGRLDTRAGTRLPVAEQRRPELRAHPVAGAPVVAVLLEEIQGVPL